MLDTQPEVPLGIGSSSNTGCTQSVCVPGDHKNNEQVVCTPGKADEIYWYSGESSNADPRRATQWANRVGNGKKDVKIP
jgi:ApbE superfamily uncharacterized protein (UPF0280 family)